MKVYRQNKKRFYKFLESIRRSYELIGPIKRDLIRFEKIENPEQIYLERNSYFPIKEYFFKKEDILFNFKGNSIKMPILRTPQRVFFGLRRCDLNAIKHQDIAFAKDPYYKAAREDSFLLGYHCDEAPSPFCFCGSLDLEDFFDLMFYDKKSFFLVEVGSEKGEFLIKKYKRFFIQTDKFISSEERIIKGADRLEKKDISKLYDHKEWEKGVELCLSCAACTNLCPTCYCFSIFDRVSVKNPKSGERVRKWSSCMLKEFTKVAGGNVFRDKREERFKHRIYHQLDYFKKRYGVNLCVGCGRCIEGCPTRIDFVDIINKMKDEKK